MIQRQASRFSWLPRPILVAALGALALVLAPLLLMLVSTLGGGAERVVERWGYLEAAVFDRLVNSLVLAGGVTVLSVLIGVPLALALHRTDFLGRRLAGVLYVVPLLIPPHIHAIAWLRIIGNTGYLANWLIDRGFDFNVRSGFIEIGGEATFYPGSTWIMTSAFWPIVALVTSAGLAGLDARYEEAALVTMPRRRVLARLTLPLLRPWIATGAFFVFLFAVGCYAVPSLLDTPTIMQEIWFPSNNVDVETAAVVALPLVGLTMLGLVVVSLTTGRRVLSGTEGRRSPSSALRRRSAIGFLTAWGILIVTAGWPMWSLVRKAGSLATYRAVWAVVQRPGAENITNSVILATAAAVGLAVLGALIALAIRGLGGRRGFLLEVASLLPFAFPPIVVGVAINLFWSRLTGFGPVEDWIYEGPGIGILALSTLFLPFAVLSVRVAIDRIGAGRVEAARLARGASIAVATRIVLPLAAPGIAAAALLGFVFGLGELAAGLIVNPGRWQTAQVRIFNMIHFARDEEVAALCVIMVLIALVPLAIYAIAANRKVEIL